MRAPTGRIDFYPRPPRGGRQSAIRADLCQILISIHALREEGDALGGAAVAAHPVFLSTPSARRATLVFRHHVTHTCISIHALREEGDQAFPAYFGECLISIHALREEGDDSIMSVTGGVVSISIHALREEGDCRYDGCVCGL